MFASPPVDRMQHAAPVDSPQQFCLRWNNYQSNLTNVFDQLLQSESFVDVTLACDGHSVKAHKMVLSACSPYFQSLFFDTPCQHPIVILKDIKWTELKAVVEFMYKGEINVSQEQIGPLLKVAESLKIRGLADVNSDSEFGSVDAAKKTSSGWDSRQSTPFVQDLSESAMSPSSILHRQKKRRRTSGERSSISSPEESIGGGDTDIGNSTLDMSPHTPSAAGAGPMVNSHTIMPPNHNHPPPQSGPPNIVNLSSETTVGLPLPPPPPPPPPSSHMMDDLEIKPGIAEMIREEERAKLLESSQAWLGASTSSIAVDSYQYQLQSMWQKCWNTNQSLVHNLRFRERGPLKSWRPETMAEAIFSVLKEGLSLSQAARKYDIPYPTFVLYANRVHNMLGPSSDGGADLRPKGRGRPQRILLGSWPEEHIRGVIRAVVFRDPQHIKEEQQHLAYSRLPVCSSDLAEPLSSQGYVSPLPNGPEPSVSPGAAAAAAVAAVAQGLRQQMCNMVAAAQQHQHEANLMNSLGSLMNRCNSLGLPTNGNSHCLPPLSLHSPTSPIGSSPTPSPEVEVGLGLTYKPPLNFSSPRPEALFQEDLEDIVGSPDGFIKNSSDSFKTPSDSFLKSSAENFMKSAAENFMKSSENFVKPPDSFMKTPTNSFKPPSDNFMKSPSDNFMKSPSNNFGKSPSDNFGKSSDNFGKTSDNFGKSPSDNFGKSDNFKSPSDGFNKNSSDSFARSPDCFAKSPSDSFTKSPSDSFVKTPSDNFVRPPSVKQEPMMEASQNME